MKNSEITKVLENECHIQEISIRVKMGTQVYDLPIQSIVKESVLEGEGLTSLKICGEIIPLYGYYGV